MKGNLLIIDDEVDILATTKGLLEDIADEIFIAYDGLQALEALKKETLHCIICDINMPNMNGIELIKTVRGLGIETPFIFYTGHGSEEHMMEVVKYGTFDFINKPNFLGLEEIAKNGLLEGLRLMKKFDREPEGSFISDYQKFIKTIGEDE
jgi:two-component system chemotaxis response regulator CheY